METQEPSGVEGETGGTVELVDLHEASDEDLDAFLANPESLSVDSQEGTANAPEDSATNEEDTQVEKPAEEKPQYVSREEFEELRQKYEKQVKRNGDQERFIGRQSQEIGQLRKQLVENIAVREDRLKNLELSADEEFEERFHLKQEKEALTSLDERESELQRFSTNQQAVSAHLGEEQLPVEDMAALFKEDGLPEESIEIFRRNPLQFPAMGLIQTAKRAKERRLLTELYKVATALRTENENLKSQAKQKPKEVVSSLNRAFSKTPSLNVATGGGTSTDRVNAADVSKLSDAELDEILKGQKL